MVQLRESNVRPVKRSTEWAYSAAVEYKNSEIMKEMFYIDTFQYSFSGLYFLSKIWMWRQAILNDVTGLMPLVFGIPKNQNATFFGYGFAWATEGFMSGSFLLVRGNLKKRGKQKVINTKHINYENHHA